MESAPQDPRARESPTPLQRLEFETQRLVDEHPPVWHDRNKRVVYGIACPDGSPHGGRLHFTRWLAIPQVDRIDVPAVLDRVDGRPGFYDYGRSSDRPDAVEWHVNFADPHLFVAYGSQLFAQDEMQVAEHPALGALKEALAAQGVPALTVERGRPTPILVAGAERRCRIATEPNAREGRPRGLYGNAFAHASVEAVRSATTRLDPPIISNIIAIAAPTGSGRYTQDQIAYVLQTAASGFSASVIESERLMGGPAHVVVHSGFWGCGAFGGNRVLMLMLQMVAAGVAGLDRLVLHLGDAGSSPLEEARRTLTQVGGGTSTVSELVQRIAGLGFVWGVSDGN